MLTQEELTHLYRLIGAAYEVYNQLGSNLQEQIYQEAFAVELTLRNIPYIKECRLNVFYKGRMLEKIYKPDFYSEGVIIEFKSVPELMSEHRAQLFNYMRISRKHLGLLVNFGGSSLRCERYYLNCDTNDMILLSNKNISGSLLG